MKLEGSRMGSVISQRSENAPSTYEYIFLSWKHHPTSDPKNHVCHRFEQTAVGPLERDIRNKSNHSGDSWQKLSQPYSISIRKNETKLVITLLGFWQDTKHRKNIGLWGMFPFIKIQRSCHRNTTVKMDTIEYIENITHNLSTKYA